MKHPLATVDKLLKDKSFVMRIVLALIPGNKPNDLPTNPTFNGMKNRYSK